MKVVTFGEIMLRLSTKEYNRFLQSTEFNVCFGGGEANVAVSLANLGIESTFVSALPDNDIGQMAINSLRKFGVNTKMINRSGDRIGIYYLEKGASQRPSKVIYDRAKSSIAEAKKEDFNWDKIFEDADWFHFTGITPALGDGAIEICEEALKMAKARGIMVSCDLNYRKKLWDRKKANFVMTKLMEYVDVCICNEEDASDVFGIKAKNSNIDQGVLEIDGYKDVAKQLKEKFNFKYIAITLRESLSANDNNWSALLCDGNDFIQSKKYKMHIIDRVGGGDSFAGGLIYALLNKMDNKDAINFAVASSCLKHSIEGDFNLVSVNEVLNLMNGDASGRVQR